MEVFVEGYRGDGENYRHQQRHLAQPGLRDERALFVLHRQQLGQAHRRPSPWASLATPTTPACCRWRPGAWSELEPCLEKLVPIIQQAIVDYMRRQRAEVFEVIHEFNEAGHATSWWEDIDGQAGVCLGGGGGESQIWSTMKERGIMGNGTSNPSATSTWSAVRDHVRNRKALADERADENVAPDTVVTNRFIDPEIGLE